MNKKCMIIGAGELWEEEKQEIMDHLQEDMLLIAADGGMRYCRMFCLKPDVCLGDFDSSDDSEIDYFGDSVILRLPRQKDDTDMLAALKYGMEQGCTEFYIFGGIGGRLDHTIANLQCLVYLKRRGCRGTMFFNGGSALVLKNETLCLPARTEGLISVFALSPEAGGVTLEGLKYPLREAQLRNEFPIGISNEFTGRESRITVRDGELLVIRYFD